METHEDCRRRAMARRWMEFGFVTVASVVLALVLLWWYEKHLAGEPPPWWLWVGPSTVVGLIVLAQGFGRGFARGFHEGGARGSRQGSNQRLKRGVARGITHQLAFLGLLHARAYPPLWPGIIAAVGTALCLVGYGIVLDLEAEWLKIVGRIAVAVAGAALLAGTTLIALLVRTPWLTTAIVDVAGKDESAQARTEGGGGADGQMTIGDLREWVHRDDPVADAERDLFEHARVAATRIAERLTEEDLPPQALIGPLGSGKTTIRHLLADELRRQREPAIELVPVELWPYETAQAAVRGIIAALVDALEARVNVIALKGIPASYADAISSTGGLASALGRLAQPLSTPLERLDVIARVASAVGVQYVLWVEDLERFAVGASAEGSVETPEEAQRLAPIRALLHGLDRLPSITVVTATTRLYQRFDLDKIARYVERLPPPKPSNVRRLVRLLRENCLRTLEDRSDPTPAGVRRDLGWEVDESELARTKTGDRSRTLAESCIALCRTPRVLKQALRRSDNIWRALPGEIDFDAVLAMSFVREATPAGFAIVEDHVDWIRDQSSGTPSDGDGDPISRLRGALDAADLPARTADAVVDIVEKTVRSPALAQGFAHSTHADYWQRFVAIPKLRARERDQNILHEIDQGTDDDLLDLLQDRERSKALEHFAERLEGETLVRLLLRMPESIAAGEPDEQAGDRPWSGLIPLWRIVLKRSRTGAISATELMEKIGSHGRGFARSDRETAPMLESWLDLAYNMSELLPGDARTDVEGRLRDVLREQYRGQARRLAKDLDSASPSALLRLCWGTDPTETRELEPPPLEGWTEFAETVLRATDETKMVMLPQLARLLVREAEGLESGACEYVPSRCAALFGGIEGGVERVLELFRELPEQLRQDTHVAAVHRASVAAS